MNFQWSLLLYLVRLKNLIILSNGENIPAERIEQHVHTIPYVKEVIAYGKNNLITIEVFLDEEFPDCKKQIQEDVKKLNQQLPLMQNIGNIVIRETEFPKTTTKKIMRKKEII